MPGLFTHWTRKDIPDLRGKVAVVTGGNSGIGFEVCRQLLERHAAVVMVVRNKELGEQAVEDLKEEFPGAKVRAALTLYVNAVPGGMMYSYGQVT
jgi:NAD(P)-dependent dehydrogenase (short-subunit alcohol dehydrogenase family)